MLSPAYMSISLYILTGFVGTISGMVTCRFVIRFLPSYLYVPHNLQNNKQLVGGVDYTTLMPKSNQTCHFLWRTKKISKLRKYVSKYLAYQSYL
jgi:hypothetical protein